MQEESKESVFKKFKLKVDADQPMEEEEPKESVFKKSKVDTDQPMDEDIQPMDVDEESNLSENTDNYIATTHWLSALPPEYQNIERLELLAKLTPEVFIKIISYLPANQILGVCSRSHPIKAVCDRYDMSKLRFASKAFAFGKGQFGVLGDGNTDAHAVVVPTQIPFESPIKIISCGMLHTAFITEDGRAFAFGHGQYGNLGDGNTDAHDVAVPTQIPFESPIKMISCGAQHTAFVTENGRAFAFGIGLFGRLGDDNNNFHEVAVPTQIPFQSPIKMISCGVYHTAFVTEDGRAFAFGVGEDGKLGNGNTGQHNVAVPTQIPFQSPIKMISCGREHTAFITEDGRAFAFGFGGSGKLGDGRIDDHAVAVPTQIPFESPIKMISCGSHHTAFVTEDGRAFAFGNGEGGRLGNNRTTDHAVAVPTQIPFQSPIKMISCGYYQTAFVTEDGRAFDFGIGGSGGGGIFGRGVPTQIPFVESPIKTISCGAYHTAFVTEPFVFKLKPKPKEGGRGIKKIMQRGKKKIIKRKQTQHKLQVKRHKLQVKRLRSKKRKTKRSKKSIK